MARTSAGGGYRIETAGEAWTIAHAAATDATNRRKGDGGPRRWDRADQEFHTETLYRQLTNFGFWRNDAPTELYFAMVADRSAPFVLPAHTQGAA